jgi:hypothetical protein
VIWDSVEGIVWAVPAGGEGAPVEGRDARQDNRLFLDGPARVCYCFSELIGPARRFMGPVWRLRFHAKRKRGQAIENKQFCETPRFAPQRLTTSVAKPLVSLGEGILSLLLASGRAMTSVLRLRVAVLRNGKWERLRRFAYNLRRESIFFSFLLATL